MKYTIVIPAYNVEDYINNTIDSVLSQTYKDIEIIIINDGSTDNTISVISNYENHNQIKIINQKNKGVSAARNVGIKEATGDYIFFLDADDTIEPNLFEDVNVFIKKNIDKVEIVSFGYNIIKNKVIKDEMSRYEFNERVFESHFFLNSYLKKEIYQCMCSFVVKRELVIDEKIFFDESTFNGEDQEFQIKCMLKAKEVLYLSFPYFNYIVRDNSAVNSGFSEKYITLLNAFIRLDNYVNNNKRLENEVKENLIRYSNLIYFYTLRKAVKSKDKKLISEVVLKKAYFNSNYKFKLDKLGVKLLFCSGLNKVSAKLLTKILSLT
ncbi:glycosyltransferase family 2 protein [Tenacibaculum soleae]|uniref:Glycosyltransferase 2-like domain-containing protein n=1 Tax=Tenacibaculum soleae TaxID=447689 RepID=A0A1B9XZS8_9FLAO|nr:glycosyltransferase family A protein [Tenacibaculum soleae]MDO6811819.1 glycosyltransferase family A protein [Tenacibaculum soleae]OCK43075.1 hypothetical protein BA195_09310 [Tenacibaculum soleae]